MPTDLDGHSIASHRVVHDNIRLLDGWNDHGPRSTKRGCDIKDQAAKVLVIVAVGVRQCVRVGGKVPCNKGGHTYDGLLKPSVNACGSRTKVIVGGRAPGV